MSNCESCKSKQAEPVPFAVHESDMAREERHSKRLVIALIVVVCLWFATIGIAVYERLQYDYTSDMTTSKITVDGKDGVANYIGNNGDINNGADHGTKSN